MPLQSLPEQPPKPISEEDAKEAMKALGKRVAYLVALAPLTDEARAEIIQTIPFMSFAQIDELAKMLEAGIRESGGDPKVDAAAEQYAKRVQEIDAEAGGELDAIEKELAAEEPKA